MRVTHPINAAVKAYEGCSATLPDEAVVVDGPKARLLGEGATGEVTGGGLEVDGLALFEVVGGEEFEGGEGLGGGDCGGNGGDGGLGLGGG